MFPLLAHPGLHGPPWAETRDQHVASPQFTSFLLAFTCHPAMQWTSSTSRQGSANSTPRLTPAVSAINSALASPTAPLSRAASPGLLRLPNASQKTPVVEVEDDAFAAATAAEDLPGSTPDMSQDDAGSFQARLAASSPAPPLPPTATASEAASSSSFPGGSLSHRLGETLVISGGSGYNDLLGATPGNTTYVLPISDNVSARGGAKNTRATLLLILAPSSSLSGRFLIGDHSHPLRSLDWRHSLPTGPPDPPHHLTSPARSTCAPSVQRCPPRSPLLPPPYHRPHPRHQSGMARHPRRASSPMAGNRSGPQGGSTRDARPLFV